MGRLGWTPAVALRTDPQLILLAWEGYQEDREELERIIFAAQGIQLPARRQEEDPTPIADKWRAFVKEHNAAFKARQKREARLAAATGAKPAKPGSLQPE